MIKIGIRKIQAFHTHDLNSGINDTVFIFQSIFTPVIMLLHTFESISFDVPTGVAFSVMNGNDVSTVDSDRYLSERSHRTKSVSKRADEFGSGRRFTLAFTLASSISS